MRSVIVTLGMMAGQGAVLAAIALVLSRLGRLRPAWQALVWLVVLVKLSIPWGPALPWSLSDIIAMFTEHGAPPASPLPPALQGPVASAQPSGVWTLLVILWAVGAAFVIARAIVAQVIAVRVARRGTLLETIGRVRVVVGPSTCGPHVVGVFRPRIVVPPALVAEPAMLRAALFHELAHIQRRDSLARVLEVWAAAIMWWNPVARFVLRRLDAAREAACDAYALDHGIERPAYARLLLQMATLRSPQPALAVPHARDRRVAAVLAHQRRPRRTGLAHAFVLLAFAVISLGGARSAAAHGRPTCMYSPQMAQSLYVSHPEFDLDGDGELSRDEACNLQAELRRQKEVLASPLDPEAETLLSEPLCCNCDEGGAYSTPATASCQNQE
ncbi:MAG TPA: M56 family metallopeptidase [Kofleriaceae bacterium]|nr:M56 family metallopeptidase [Kofleriaceae bacterium]